MKAFVLTFLALTIWLTHVLAQPLTSAQTLQLEQLVERTVAPDEPGLAIGIVQDGQVIFSAYRGKANLSHQVDIDQQTRFNIASVAKQFTALATLQLIEEGKLSLDDDIRKFFPDFYPKISHPIQVRHLLNHTSGIRDFYDLLSMQFDPWWRKEGYDNNDAIELLAQQQALNFVSGTDHLYSNSNYTLLAKIIELVSGQSFHEYTSALFSNYGMNSTSFLENYMYVITNLALPYTDWGDGIWQQYPMMTNLYGDGFLFTTLDDQLAYEVAIQNRAARTATLAQSPIIGNDYTAYGYGLEFKPTFSFPSVRHSGSTGAYHAQVIRIPEKNLAIVVMSNNGTIWSGSIAEAALKILLGPSVTENTDKPTINPEVTASASPLSQLTGIYESVSGGLVRITKKDDALYWQEGNNNPRKMSRKRGNLFYWDQLPGLEVAISLDATSPSLTVYYPGSEPAYHPKLKDFTPDYNYFSSLVGDYHSEELSLTFSLHLKEDTTLLASFSGKSKMRKVELITEDYLKVSDFKLSVKRGKFSEISSLLVTSNRVRNLEFSRKNPTNRILDQPTKDGGRINVAITSPDYGKGEGDILLTKTDVSGNEEWFKTFGGSSYERVTSVVVTPDKGYLILGSTSSFGSGNYDVYLIKTDERGKEIWSKTYGGPGNEYGLEIISTDDKYILRAGRQADSKDLIAEDKYSSWVIQVDLAGNLLDQGDY